jgi:hypothetical protein
MFGFKTKEPEVKPVAKEVDPDISIKLQVLEKNIMEQRVMIRQLLKITTMMSEHKRYELIQPELHRLSNLLDRIK